MTRARPRRPVSLLALALASALALVCPEAGAVVEGTSPQVLHQTRLWGSVTTAGATMMDEDTHYHANRWLKPENSVQINGIPLDAEVQRAYLWWAGSMHLPPEEGGIPDRYVDFTLADGSFFSDLTTDGPTDVCYELSNYGGFFYCRKEITALVDSQGTGSYNGQYTLGALDSHEGDCDIDPNCQARFGAFALSIVWESASYDHRRDVIIYDGFMAMQERNDDPEVHWNGVTSFTLSDFLVGDPPRGEFVFFGMEGDRQLGSPPFPQTNGDWIALDGTNVWNYATPEFPENPPYNVWNSTSGLGVDIDYFDIGVSGLNILRPGQTTMTVDLGSGDGVEGVVDPMFPDHDMMVLGWVTVALDTLAPNFDNTLTTKIVDRAEAAPGEVLTYTLTVTNTGSAEANHVVLQDTMPPNTTYVPGSTRFLGGGFVPDVGGQSALVGGLDLGTMGFYPDPSYQAQVEFKVRIDDGAPAGYLIENVAFVGADEVEPPDEVGRAQTRVIAPELGEVRKTWELVPGGFAVPGPGSQLRYTVEIENASVKPAGGITFVDDLPEYVDLVAVQAPPGATVLSEDLGTHWRITVSELSIPPSWTAQVVYTVQVFSEAQFGVAGIGPDEIDGLVLENQGLVDAPYLDQPLRSDDPAQPGTEDPTRVTLVYAAILDASAKTVEVEGGAAVPGSLVTYTISLRNDGNRPAQILDLLDEVHPALESPTLVSSDLPVQLNGTRLEWSGSGPFPLFPGPFPLTVVFTARVRSDATHGTVITNVANVDVNPDPNLRLEAPEITVVDEPLFTSSVKEWSNASGPPVTPGEELTFTFTVRNSGTPADNVVLEDVLDRDFVEYVAGSGGTYDAATGTVSFSWPAFAAGEEQVVSFRVKVRDDVPLPGPSFLNCGLVRSDEIPDGQEVPCVEIPLELAPSLALLKIVEDPPGGRVVPGQEPPPKFRITVTNNGVGPAHDLVLTDKILAPLILDNTVPIGEYDPPSGTLRWTRDILEPGEVWEIQIWVRVPSPLDPTTIPNTARLTAAELPVELTSTTELIVRSGYELSFAKDVDVPLPSVGSAVPGQTLTYTLTVTNDEDSTQAARNVGLGDPLGPLLDAGWITEAGIDRGVGFWEPDLRTIVWTPLQVPALAEIAPGESVSVTFKLTIVNPHEDGEFGNQAGVSVDGSTTPILSDDPRDGTVDNADAQPTVVRVENGPAFFGFTKALVPFAQHYAQPGDERTFVLSLANEGTGPAFDTVIRDPIPRYLEVLDMDGGALEGGAVVWRPGTLAAGEGWSARLRVKLDLTCEEAAGLEDEAIANRAAAQARDTQEFFSRDPQPIPEVPDDGLTRIRVSCDPELEQFYKSVRIENERGNPEAVYPGLTELHYEIRLTNSGGAETPSDLAIVDALPQGLTVDPASVTGGARLEGREILLDGFGLGAGETRVIEYVGTVNEGTAPGTVLSNQATLQLSSGAELLSDGDPATPRRDPTVVYVDYPDLSDATKTVDPGRQIKPGDPLTYVFLVTNRGTKEALDTVLVDVVDLRYLTDVSGDYDRFEPDTGRVTWLLGQVAPGERRELRLDARVQETVPNGQPIRNQGTVLADHGQREAPVIVELTDDPDTPDEPDDDTEVTVTSEVTFNKRIFTSDGRELPLGERVARGERVRYELHLSNATGPAAEIRDRVPGRLTDVQIPDEGVEFTWDESSRLIVWTLGDLGPGREFTLNFSAQVKVDAAPGEVSNQADYHLGPEVNARSNDPRTDAAADPTVFRVLDTVDFSRTTKKVTSHDDRVVGPGDIVTYKIEVPNDGPESSVDARLKDEIPPRTEYVPGSTWLNGTLVDDGGLPPMAQLGGMVISASGAPPGVIWGLGGSAQVEFSVRVADDAPQGTVIENQAEVVAEGVDAVPSDDPDTETIEDDPTVVTVGLTPSLLATTKKAEAQVRPGDRITYTIRIPNSGTSTAFDVVLTDPIPEGTAYVAGSLTLGGRSLTDAVDGDEGQYVGDPAPAVVVRVGEIAVREAAEVTFQVTALEERVVANQGTVTATGLAAEQTDANDDVGDGNQPTTTSVGYQRELAAEKTVADVDGGTVLPGDELLYEITLRNIGAAPVDDASVSDDVPEHTEFVASSLEATRGTASFSPPPAGAAGNGRVVVNDIALDPGGVAVVRFRVTVDPEAPRLTTVSNLAAVAATGVDRFETEPAVVVVGQVTGAAALSGVVFEDRDTPDGVFLRGQDIPLAGFQVIAVPVTEPDADPVRTAETDADGRFEMYDLPAPGEYLLRVKTANDVQFSFQDSGGEVGPNEVRDLDVQVNPTGRVYLSGDGTLIAGALVTLYHYDATAEDYRGAAVAAEDLPAGQQEPHQVYDLEGNLVTRPGQLTDQHGMYQFDPPPGRYVIGLTEPSELLIFPSISPPPTAGPAEAEGEYGFVVPAPEPDLAQELRYYLQVQPGATGLAIHHNHIPVDPLKSWVRFDLRANKRDAMVGEVVTYLGEAVNRSSRSLAVGGPSGGVYLRAVIPQGFHYVRGSARVEMEAPGGSRVRYDVPDSVSRKTGDRNLLFGPFSLHGGGRIGLLFQAVIGGGVPLGEWATRGWLQSGSTEGVRGAGIDVSEEASAKVRVIEDPLFDRGYVIGKVFCDADGDGWQDPGEVGVPDVEVYADTGSYAVTDSAGKYHLQNLLPGLRAFKAAAHTLPPGAEFTTDETRLMRLQGGALVKVNFGVTCPTETVYPDFVDLAPEPPPGSPEAAPEAGGGRLQLTGNLLALTATVDGTHDLPTVNVDAWLPRSAEDPEQDRFPDLVLSGDALAPPARFHTRVLTREDIHTWILEVRQRDGPRLHRLEGEGRPPKVLEWNGRGAAGQGVLASGQSYEYQLTVRTAAGSIGVSPRRIFGVAAGRIVAPPTSPGQVIVGGERVAADEHGFFATAVPLPTGRAPLAVRLVRPDGKGVTFMVARPERLAQPAAQARTLHVTGNVVGLTAAVDGGRDLPTVNVDVQVLVPGADAPSPTPPDLTLTEGRLAPPVRFRTRVLTREEVHSWSLEIRARDGGPLHRLSGQALPPREILWDGTGAEGIPLLAAGAVYDVQLAVRTTTGSLGYSPVRSFGVETGGGIEPPAASRPLALVGTRSVAPDAQGYFSLQVPPPEEPGPLAVTMVRADGKAVELMAPVAGQFTLLHDEASTAPTTPVELYGNLAERTVVLDGQPLDLDLAGLDCAVEAPGAGDPRLELRGDLLSTPARFHLTGVPETVAAWHLVIGDREGRALVVAAAGSGVPPPVLTWAGPGSGEGRRTLGVGLYSYRLVVRRANGDRAMSPLRPLLLTGPSVELALSADPLFVPGKKMLTREGRQALELKIPELQAAGGRVAVEVHSDTAADTEQILQLTQERADTIRRFLLRLGFEPGAVSAVGLGDLHPKVPNINRRNRAKNRRVVLLAGAPPVSSQALPAVSPRVSVSGRDVPLDAGLSFHATLALPAGRQVAVTLEFTDAEGRRVVLSRDVTTRPPLPTGPATVGVAVPGPIGEFALAPGAGEADPAEPAAAPPVAAPTWAQPGPLRVRPADTDAAAGRLMVELPPFGAPIRSEQYRLRGVTTPGNRVAVNGQEVTLDEHGAFEHLVTLEHGPGVLEVVATDPAGNRSRIRRNVDVDLDHWFLLAVGDGLIGNQDVDLDEMNGHTTLEVANDQVKLHGRASGYFKARIRGETIFKDYRITGHFDSGKQEESALLSQVIDPERYYPVYGDASQEVRDVNSRGKFYVLVQADQTNELRVGNFATAMEDGDLFRFNRTSYGGRAQVDHEFVEGHRTQVKTFVTDSGVGTVHGHDELRGTGGSVYYLKYRDVLEGSEQVLLTVRDRDTGMVLLQTPLLRDQDYLIRYPEGRLLMKQPVSSVVDATFLMTSGSASTLDGHPVFLVVDYEAAGDGRHQMAYGVHAKQTLFDTLTLGGGYVTEERFGGSDYELWGTSTEIKLTDRSVIRAEVAHSQAAGSDAFYSENGGLDFTPLDLPESSQRGGYGFKVEARSEVGEWLQRPDFLQLHGYYQFLEDGFFSGSTLNERGQQKFGFSANYKITDQDRLVLRHDGNIAELPDPLDPGGEIGLNKQISALHFARRIKDYALTAEYAHTYAARDAAIDGDDQAVHTESFAAGFKYNFTERWSAFVEQQIDVPHGEGAQEFSGRDVRSTVGVALRLDEDLWGTLAATEQWSGNTGLQVGLKSALSEDTDVYIRERLGIDLDGETTSTTVLGGENRYTRGGRLFSEYQLDAGAGPAANRAVVGLGHRWKILEGLYLDVAGERQQVLSSASGDSARTVGSVGYEYLAPDWIKLSGRYELRYDEQEESRGGQDRLQFLTLNAASWQWTKDLAFLARLNYAQTENLAFEWTDALLLELSAGVAYRPVDHEWFNLLTKYTKRIELRRDAGDSGFGPQKWDADIFALVPVVELPFRVQLSETLVLRHRREWIGDLDEVTTLALLSLSRINFHVTNSIDVGVEYRLRKHWLGSNELDLRHGVLTEVSYEFLNHVRIGVGYNFSRFDDNLYRNDEEDAHGFFFRVVGKY